MSHPKNKKDRGEKGTLKSIKRVILMDRSEPCIKRQRYLLRDTTKLCSCPMCGNQRKNFGETLQEKKNKVYIAE